MNVLNKDGFTPFLSYVKLFTSKLDELKETIKREILYLEWKRQKASSPDIRNQTEVHKTLKNVHLFDES